MDFKGTRQPPFVMKATYFPKLLPPIAYSLAECRYYLSFDAFLSQFLSLIGVFLFKFLSLIEQNCFPHAIMSH